MTSFYVLQSIPATKYVKVHFDIYAVKKVIEANSTNHPKGREFIESKYLILLHFYNICGGFGNCSVVIMLFLQLSTLFFHTVL